MHSVLVRGFLFFIFALSSAAYAKEGSAEEENLWSGGAPPGGDFILQSAGGPISLQGLRGKVVLLFFGYTSCPDVCPLDLRIMAEALDGLSKPQLDRVQGLFVSVDPKRDSVEKLQEYTSYFHSKILGLTDTEDVIKKVATLYGVQYHQVALKDSKLPYSVNHSAVTYLIDPEGELRFIFPHQTPAQTLHEAAVYILDQFPG